MQKMSRKYKKEDAMLRHEHESTLEKMEKKRDERRAMLVKQFNKVVKDKL